MLKHANSNNTYSFREAMTELGVTDYGMNKLIDYNLLDVVVNARKSRDLRYGGAGLNRLFRARNNPLELPRGEKALIAIVGVEDSDVVPSLFMDATAMKQWCEEGLSHVLSKVDRETRLQIQDQRLRVTGYWSVAPGDVDFLVENKSVFLASYGGFLLEGGRIADCVDAVRKGHKVRCFLIKPFDAYERHVYCDTFFRSRRGPSCKVWTSEEIAAESVAR